MHLLTDAGREHGDAGREHPERATERDRRVSLEIADVDRLGVGDVVERGIAETLERTGREPARQDDVELPGRRRLGAHGAILPTHARPGRESRRITSR